jgi:hypothetical protein
VLGNAFGNADNEGNFGLKRLLDTGSSHGGSNYCSLAIIAVETLGRLSRYVRDEKSSGSCASLLYGLADILEDREVKVSAAGLLGVGAANDLGA